MEAPNDSVRSEYIQKYISDVNSIAEYYLKYIKENDDIQENYYIQYFLYCVSTLITIEFDRTKDIFSIGRFLSQNLINVLSDFLKEFTKKLCLTLTTNHITAEKLRSDIKD